MTQYTTYGPVRGQCRHAHNTYHDALKCCNTDRRIYGRTYSDRSTYAIDGDGYLINDFHQRVIKCNRHVIALCAPA